MLREKGVLLVAMPLVFISALPKTVQFPFHTWLPDGTVAPTSATVLFHVCGFQTGVYVIVRFFFQVFHPHLAYTLSVPFASFFGNINLWNFVISLTGAITLLIAALNGVIENDFKRVVAYSTISELGYMVMVIGFNTTLGVTAGLFHLMSHAFIRPNILFLLIHYALENIFAWTFSLLLMLLIKNEIKHVHILIEGKDIFANI